MASDNIFQQWLHPPKSVMDYTSDHNQATGRKQSLQQSGLVLPAADVCGSLRTPIALGMGKEETGVLGK